MMIGYVLLKSSIAVVSHVILLHLVPVVPKLLLFAIKSPACLASEGLSCVQEFRTNTVGCAHRHASCAQPVS